MFGGEFSGAVSPTYQGCGDFDQGGDNDPVGGGQQRPFAVKSVLNLVSSMSARVKVNTTPK